MPTNRSVSSQGAKFYVEDIAVPAVSPAPATLTIAASGGVVVGATTEVEFTAAHGLAEGDVVTLVAVTGMSDLDGLTAPITIVDTTTIEMLVDTTGTTGTPTGGTAHALAFHELCLKDFELAGGEASQLDATTMCSTAKEYQMGLRDSGTATVNYNEDPCEEGQRELSSAQQAGTSRWFRFKFPIFQGDSTHVWKEFEAFVTSTGFSAGVDALITGTASLRVTGDITTVGC
jgi:Lambda phage tail tube protein, TTP